MIDALYYMHMRLAILVIVSARREFFRSAPQNIRLRL